MNILLWRNFIKRRNSTKLPAAGDGVPMVVTLKESTSIENPVFILRSNDFSFNYAQAFDHFYFITNIISTANGMLELHCEQDVLATFKSAITNTTARVLYSSSNYDLSIKDDRMKVTSEVEYHVATGYTDAPFNTTGIYILSVMNGNSTGTGGLATYYALTESELASISANILSNPSFFQQLVGQFMNPMEAIISCIWLPISASVVSGSRRNVFIGSEDTGVEGKLLSERIRNYTFSVQLPLDWTNPTYKNVSPISTGLLYLPFVGAVDVDLDTRYDNELITGDLYFDAFTGDIVYVIDTGDNVVTYSGNCASKVPLSAASYNPMGVLTSTASLIGSIATGNIAGVVGSTVNTIESFKIHTQQNGSLSSVLGAYAELRILAVVYEHQLTDDIESLRYVQGLPCYKTLSLGTLNGYVQCEKASVNLAGLAGDRDAVNSFLNGGFFLE